MHSRSFAPLFVALAACASPAHPSADADPNAPRVTIELDDGSLQTLIGHRRQVAVGADGWMRVVYVRFDTNGRRHQVERDAYDEHVLPSLQRLVDLPEQVDAWIMSCPALLEATADVIEQGARYRGLSEFGGHVRGPFFWSSREHVNFERKCAGEVEQLDPLDSLVLFLLSAHDAAASSTYEAIEYARDLGEIDARQAQLQIARVRAEHVVRVVTLVQQSADCLALDEVDPTFGADYYRLQDRVEETSGAPQALAAYIAEDPGAFGYGGTPER